MRVFAVASHKGGVGKTTTVLHLGTALADVGLKVLLVDIDPQGALTHHFGDWSDFPTTADVLREPARMMEGLYESRQRIHLLPASPELALVLMETCRRRDGSYLLRRALNLTDIDFDFVLIDTPSMLGMATLNAMCAAEYMLVPTTSEFLAVRGLADTYNMVEATTENTLVRPKIRCLMTFHSRAGQGLDIASEIENALPGALYKTKIPRTPRFAEAPALKETLFTYAPRSQGVVAYRALAKEILLEETQYGTEDGYNRRAGDDTEEGTSGSDTDCIEWDAAA